MKLLLLTAAVGLGLVGSFWLASASAPASPDEVFALADEMLDGRSHGATGAGLHYSHAFEGYALVNLALADPSSTPAAARRIDGLIDRMLALAASAHFGGTRVEVAGQLLSPSVALRGHLALLLAGRAKLGAVSAAQSQFRQRLFHGLAEDVLNTPGHLLPSYGRRVWPADNEVLAAAFELAPERQTDPAVARAGEALRASLDSLETRGFPPSEVASDSLKPMDVPRGCALSWSVAMRGFSSPDRARALYRPYRSRFFVSYGPVVGFREWPPGVDRPSDFDSGPIILGIGVAASGIGLGAAQLAHEGADYAALRRSANIAGRPLFTAARGSHWLERAMWNWAVTARAWKDDPE